MTILNIIFLFTLVFNFIVLFLLGLFEFKPILSTLISLFFSFALLNIINIEKRPSGTTIAAFFIIVILSFLSYLLAFLYGVGMSSRIIISLFALTVSIQALSVILNRKLIDGSKVV